MVVVGWKLAIQFMLPMLGQLEVEGVVGIIPLLFCLLGFAALGLRCYMDIDIVVLVLMGLDFFLIDSLTSTVIISKILAKKIQAPEQQRPTVQIPFKRMNTILRGSYQLQITVTSTTPAANNTTRHHHSGRSRNLPQLADSGRMIMQS